MEILGCRIIWSCTLSFLICLFKRWVESVCCCSQPEKKPWVSRKDYGKEEAKWLATRVGMNCHFGVRPIHLLSKQMFALPSPASSCRQPIGGSAWRKRHREVVFHWHWGNEGEKNHYSRNMPFSDLSFLLWGDPREAPPHPKKNGLNRAEFAHPCFNVQFGIALYGALVQRDYSSEGNGIPLLHQEVA